MHGAWQAPFYAEPQSLAAVGKGAADPTYAGCVEKNSKSNNECGVGVLISVGFTARTPHEAPNTCGEPNEIDLTALDLMLNGSWRRYSTSAGVGGVVVVPEHAYVFGDTHAVQ